MADETNYNTVMTVDRRRFRIRIHLSTFHILGIPEYIQFLVNPEEMIVALNFVGREEAGDEAHKVNAKRIETGNSYEIYTRPFVTKLSEVAGITDECCNYRLYGRVIPSRKMAVFSLKNLTQIVN